MMTPLEAQGLNHFAVYDENKSFYILTTFESLALFLLSIVALPPSRPRPKEKKGSTS